MQAAIFAGELGHVKTASLLRFWHVGDPATISANGARAVAKEYRSAVQRGLLTRDTRSVSLSRDG
jgi:hypothetical protein